MHPLAIRRVKIPVTNLPVSAAAPKIVLVCEDEDLSAACTRVLRDAGYDVHAREHSGHALLACLEGQAADVLVADLSNCEGSGPALARRMRRYNPKLKAIYLARAGTVCDADNVLVLPFTRDDLLKQLANAPEPERAGF